MEWNGNCVHRVFIVVQPGHGQNNGLMDRNSCFQNFCIVKLLTKKQSKDTPARWFNNCVFDHCLIYSTYFSKRFSSLLAYILDMLHNIISEQKGDIDTCNGDKIWFVVAKQFSEFSSSRCSSCLKVEAFRALKLCRLENFIRCSKNATT